MKQSTGSFGPPVSWGVSIALNLSALVLLGWATSLQRAKPELAELVFDRVTLDQTGAHPVKVVEPKALIRPTPPARGSQSEFRPTRRRRLRDPLRQSRVIRG